jgi:Transferrin
LKASDGGESLLASFLRCCETFKAFNIISILREFANFDDFSLISRLTTVFNFSNIPFMLCVHRSATSPEELAKCKEMLPIFTRVNATNPWTCVQEADSDACVEAVGLGTADVMVVGARDIVLAAERFGTQLVLAEVSQLPDCICSY